MVIDKSVFLKKESTALLCQYYEGNREAVWQNYARSIALLLSENKKTLDQINYQAIQNLLDRIALARKIFVTGEGRSGLVTRMFAMRLMHLGYQVYVVGETTTPPVKCDDLLIACSGSGSTGNTCHIASESKKVGARVVCITTQINSSLATISNLIVEVEAAPKYPQINQESKQFAGSLFEQTALLLFDTIFYLLSQQLDKSNQTLWDFHANLE
ncbi:MAG: 6-phospho-3-hexuloisomerase [Chroococcidiopsidaceae cyanobacterium CP_BM_RX_35]|nr:6-phospho-3-hexuloisomerase [Chroococcidiopsidaceae cyanobacterium CP_BM_RX_35]